METITRTNGNGQPYTVELPKIIIIGGKKYNDVALAHIKKNTGLDFTPTIWGDNIEAQPETSNQIVTLLLTYNFKTRYYNNYDTKNTLMLKSDHHIGFEVESVCYNCLIENHISLPVGLKKTDRLSC